ncbi:hypothetical protein ACFVGN_36175 [Streptomyces sp. NPDC057757]|uniref:hypothetical protein n=1 Tax=Streptomyces sp. NPDC057757 TaxID=3346241 RepID=UPI0036A5FCA1
MTTPLTRVEIATTDAALVYATAATPDTITAALKAAHQADWHRANPAVREEFVRTTLAAIPQLVRRILDADTERLAFRSTIAHLIVANNRGDDYSLSELASRLEAAGVDLKDDYAVADDLARAAETEGWSC